MAEPEQRKPLAFKISPELTNRLDKNRFAHQSATKRKGTYSRAVFLDDLLDMFEQWRMGELKEYKGE